MYLPAKFPAMTSATELPLRVDTQAILVFPKVLPLVSALWLSPAVCHESATGGAGASVVRLTVSGKTGGLGGGGGIIVATPISFSLAASAL